MGRISWLQTRPRGSEVVAVFILAVALYINTLFGEFVFDDHEAVQQNIDVRMDTSLRQVFTDDFWGNPLSDPESHQSYRPLTVLTYRWNRQLHGMEPVGFHLVNVMLHGVVCVLLLVVLTRSGAGHFTSLLAALLYAAHPIHTEAVANIAGRAELLSAMMFLLSVMSCQQSILADKRTNRHSLPWLLLSVALGGVAMMCKEQGITSIGVNLILVMMSAADNRQVQRLFTDSNWRRWAGPSAILVTGAIVLLGTRLLIIGRGRPVFLDSDNPASFSPHILTRFLTYSFLCQFNYWLLLCPSRLCFDWSMGSIQLVMNVADSRNIVTAIFFFSLAIVGLLCVCPPKSLLKNKMSRKGLQTVTFALSLTLLPFLPATNLFFTVGFVVAERILYVPSMGFCLLVAMGISKVASITIPPSDRRDTSDTTVSISYNTTVKKSQKDGRKLSILTTILLLFVFSAKTLARNQEWRDMQTLATAALKTNPTNAKVHFTMGNVLAQQGNRSCEKYYREALRLRANYTLAWTNLGLVLLNTDRAKEAEMCYRTALHIKPDHVTANTNMGHLCRIQSRWKEAIKHYTIASQRRPNNPILHYHIGNALIELGGKDNLEAAEKELESAVNIQPSYGEAHIALGKLLSRTLTTNNAQSTTARSQVRKAIAHLQEGLLYLQNGVDQEVYLILGKLLKADNKPKLAAEAMRRVDGREIGNLR